MHTTPLAPPTARPVLALDHDLLVHRLLSLADDLERTAGHGGHWQASMSAAARIRALAAPGHAHRQPTMRDAQVAALTPTPATNTEQAAA